METADDRVDLVDTRHRLRTPNRVDDTAMAARTDHHQSASRYIEGSTKLMLGVINHEGFAALGRIDQRAIAILPRQHGSGHTRMLGRHKRDLARGEAGSRNELWISRNDKIQSGFSNRRTIYSPKRGTIRGRAPDALAERFLAADE